MANHCSLFSFSFCFLVLLHGCSAHISMVTNRDMQNRKHRSQEQFQNKCQLQNLNALKPKFRFRSEAGLTEFWDQNEDQFQCASVAFLRHTIHRKGLLLPSYNNAPQLVYVVEGRGIHGAVFPGCPETYQSEPESQSQSQSRSRSQQQESFRDQHQKIRQIREGDILALPAGVAHWVYNRGQSQLVLVSLIDVGNFANQLDENFRKFFIAGNPQEGLVSGGESQSESQSQSRSRREQEQEKQQSDGSNIWSDMDEENIAEFLGIDRQLARKIKNPNDKRGAIVNVEDEFQLTVPERAEQEQRQEGSQQEEEEEEDWSERRRHTGQHESPNGIEETYCTMQLKQRIDSAFADVFNPQAGRVTSVNSFNFPLLRFLQLSAERGVLYKNAYFAPRWNINAHCILYITSGNGRIQVVSENGDSIFDDQVEKGQVITVPQNHAVVKKAGEQGLEWVGFKTNGNAKTSHLAGRLSVFRGLPVDVIANSFDISREEAFRLKQSKPEVSVFRGERQQQRD